MLIVDNNPGDILLFFHLDKPQMHDMAIVYFKPRNHVLIVP
jgi:hypothetical protein